MSASPLALCAVAFVAISGWLYLAPSDRKRDKSRSYEDPSGPETQNEERDVDFDDILRRAPPPPSPSAAPVLAPVRTPATSLTPADPKFHTQHLDSYDARPAFTRTRSHGPAKPSLRKANHTNPFDKSFIKPSANGRSVGFAGDPNGTAATSIVSRPAEEAEMGADLRLWDEHQELPGWTDMHQERVAAEGKPVSLLALDGSCSPLRLRPGVIPAHLAKAMQDIEDFCHQDWLRPLNEDDRKAWAKCLLDSPHSIWGSAPYWICEVVTALVPLVPLEPLIKVLGEFIPTDQAYSPAEILLRGTNPAHDLLLTVFMLPFRACVGLEWAEADKMDKRGDPRGRVSRIRAAVGEVGAVAIEWLNYIGGPYLISRMFSGRGSEILDGSVRVGIFANRGLKGYIAEITVFAPAPATLSGEAAPLLPRGWQMLFNAKGHPVVQFALGRALNLARRWIHYRFANPTSANGPDRFGYVHGGDPLVWNRLCIRPGHILDQSKLEATDNAGRVGTLPKPNAKAHLMHLSQDLMAELLQQHLQESVPIFRQLVEMIRPARLSFSNYRQNAWHSEVESHERFDDASFAFMWMLCTVGLKWMPAPADGSEGTGAEMVEVLHMTSPWEQLDLGGLVPYFDEPQLQCIDLTLFPNVTQVVLPWIAIDKTLSDITPSTASLLIDPHWCLRDYLLLPAHKTSNATQRQPIKIILVANEGTRAQQIFDDFRDTLADRASNMMFSDRQGDPARPRYQLLSNLCMALKERVLLLEETKYRDDLVKWPCHAPEEWTQWNPVPRDFVDASGIPRRRVPRRMYDEEFD